jgi:hypothetical protein
VGRQLRQRLLGHLGCEVDADSELSAVDVGASMCPFRTVGGFGMSAQVLEQPVNTARLRDFPRWPNWWKALVTSRRS